MAKLPDLTRRNSKALAALVRRHEVAIASALRDALVEIRATMAAVYERYAKNGILSHADMTRYNRLATMEKSIVDAMAPAIRKTAGVITKLPPAAYEEAFFRYAWAIEQDVGVSLKWGRLNMTAVAADLDNPYRKIALTNYKILTPVQIQRAVNKGLVVGKSYTEMMRDIKAVVNMKNYEAVRIAQTEAHTAVEAASDYAYNTAIENGVRMSVQWMATLDDRTRDDHAAMDGVIRDADGEFLLPNGEKTPYPGWEGLSAGERINCRCTTIPVIDDLQTEVDGKPVGYLTYADWIGKR